MVARAALQYGNACVNTDTDPLHCGECGEGCDADEVCLDGDCEDFETAAGCTSCPCPRCDLDEDDFCCLYPGTSDVICVEDGCP